MFGPLIGHISLVASVAFSQDGTRIVSGSDDKTIRVWHAETGELVLGPFKGHTDSVASVAFSEDGRRVVSCSDDRTIRIWKVDEDSILAESSYVSGLVNSQDIVSGSDAFRDKSEMDDGWILGPNGELIFWIPPLHQTTLWRPSNVSVIGKNPTRLDLSCFVHGSSWNHCRK
jgi:WD40 repeat protein